MSCPARLHALFLHASAWPEAKLAEEICVAGTWIYVVDFREWFLGASILGAILIVAIILVGISRPGWLQIDVGPPPVVPRSPWSGLAPGLLLLLLTKRLELPTAAGHGCSTMRVKLSVGLMSKSSLTTIGHLSSEKLKAGGKENVLLKAVFAKHGKQ